MECWVSRVIQQEKFEMLSVMDGRQISPTPEDYARPGTGMNSGLVYMTPKPQTVNLACEHNLSGLEFFRNVFEFVDKAQFEINL